jgi:uncharacterized membrane protein
MSQASSAQQRRDLSATQPHVETVEAACRDKPDDQAPNISSGERLLSLVAGSAITLLGLRRGKLLVTGLGASLLYRGYTQHCHLYDSLGIDTSRHDHSTGVAAQQGYRVEQAVLINRPAEELFNQWRDLESLPTRMRHVTRVAELDDKKSRWTIKGPLGNTLEWDAEIVNERPHELIAWQSLPNSDVDTAGSVHFLELPHNRGTVVRVALKYNPPAGKVGAWLATIFGDGLEQRLSSDLRRFKSMAEAGEAPTVHGQPQGATQPATQSSWRD